MCVTVEGLAGFLSTGLHRLGDSWHLATPGFALDKALGSGRPSVFSQVQWHSRGGANLSSCWGYLEVYSHTAWGSHRLEATS